MQTPTAHLGRPWSDGTLSSGLPRIGDLQAATAANNRSGKLALALLATKDLLLLLQSVIAPAIVYLCLRMLPAALQPVQPRQAPGNIALYGKAVHGGLYESGRQRGKWTLAPRRTSRLINILGPTVKAPRAFAAALLLVAVSPLLAGERRGRGGVLLGLKWPRAPQEMHMERMPNVCVSVTPCLNATGWRCWREVLPKAAAAVGVQQVGRGKRGCRGRAYNCRKCFSHSRLAWALCSLSFGPTIRARIFLARGEEESSQGRTQRARRTRLPRLYNGY